MKTGCILLAAGASSRFGGDKLLAPFRGRPVYSLAFDAVPFSLLCGTAVVSGNSEILSAAAEKGFVPVLNDKPEEGVSRSIRLGMEALPEMDAVLFMVADQPCLSRKSLEGLLRFSEGHAGSIVRLGFKDRVGSPVLFPGEYFSELCSLSGDTGGSAVIRDHPDKLRVFLTNDPCELMDIDSREELEGLLSALAAKRS